MNILIFTGVGPISSFSFFKPESLKQVEKKTEILDKSVDPAYKEEGLDYFDQTDGLQAPYSDDHIEPDYENKESGYDVNKFKRKAHQPQDPTRRKSRYEYQTIDYYETTDDLRAPFDNSLEIKTKKNQPGRP